LQPYGCGCVLFKDPTVARFYGHDSPYTYFTTGGGHLGEIALECSRPGAAAAALWATLRAVPLEPDKGLGDILAAGRRAAIAMADAIAAHDRLRLVLDPETDIVLFAPGGDRATAVTAATEKLFDAASANPGDPVYLAKMRVSSTWLAGHWKGLVCDADETVVARSVLMKPEHEREWPAIVRRLSELLD
ncbi:MAG: aspartate aminotransferase family protein, partial [Deltaproteobacteria bacterium]|nr:aspartate aminotransferase family protein [Deltaproteobacteria bacterium]